MYAINPYAQGGWANPQNTHSINGVSQAGFGLPPTSGALPPMRGGPHSVLKFEFCSFNPDILNCTVTGPPSQRKVFEVRTVQETTHARTTVSRENNQTFAVIDWFNHPEVEIRGVIPRLQTRDFLRLSPDQKYRKMTILGRSYIWSPHAGSTYLYAESLNPLEALARITITETRVTLEIGSEAIQPGLLEPCIMATILLSNPRYFD